VKGLPDGRGVESKNVFKSLMASDGKLAQREVALRVRGARLFVCPMTLRFRQSSMPCRPIGLRNRSGESTDQSKENDRGKRRGGAMASNKFCRPISRCPGVPGPVDRSSAVQGPSPLHSRFRSDAHGLSADTSSQSSPNHRAPNESAVAVGNGDCGPPLQIIRYHRAQRVEGRTDPSRECSAHFVQPESSSSFWTKGVWP